MDVFPENHQKCGGLIPHALMSNAPDCPPEYPIAIRGKQNHRTNTYRLKTSIPIKNPQRTRENIMGVVSKMAAGLPYTLSWVFGPPARVSHRH